MKISTDTKISVDQLCLLPGYADFLLQNHLDEFVERQITLGKEIDPPIMKYFRDMPHEQLVEIVKESAVEYLSAIADKKIPEFIATSAARWKANQLPVMQRDDVVAEDITLLTLLRKKQMLHYLPRYTSDTSEILQLVEEIDVMLTELETSSTKTYIQILNDHIAEHARELEKSEALHKEAQAMTHLGNYMWEPHKQKFFWSEELYRIFDLEPGTELSFEFIQSFTHQDDYAFVTAEVNKAIEKKESFDFFYRIITRKSNQRILHARGEIKDSVDGDTLVVGTVQDVTERQSLERELRQRDMLHRQAEQLAAMGTWSLDVQSGKLTWTDELYRIYGLEPQSCELKVDDFLSFVHPDDREMIKEGVEKMYSQDQVDYTFRIITRQGKTKWLRSVARMHYNAKGQPDLAIGTEMDITEKQELIQQLIESERLNKQAQSLAHIGNWTYDIAQKHYSWSDEMYRIYHMEKGRPISLDEWASFIVPEEREDVLQYFQDCLLEKKPYDRIHRLLLWDGTIKTVHRKGELLFDDAGNPLKMIGTTQDITEQDRIQQELKENQIFIRKIADATPSIISSYNVNTGNFVFISEGLQKLLGYEKEEVMEQGISFIWDIVHQDDIAELKRKNAKALEEANSNQNLSELLTEATYRMRNKAGEYRWFHTYGTVFDRNAEGQVEHMLNISLDTTEQVAAAEKIKEQEHFIQQIADASPTILYLFDVQQQRIVYINREIFFVLGFTPEEIMDAADGLTQMLYHPEDHKLLPERLEGEKKFQRADSMIQYECRMRNKDGDWRWLLVREIAFKTNEQGVITQILGAALDINRRKEMEKTILQNTMQLQQSNASLEEFAYVASHDLKEPLRKISTFGDRLLASQAESLAPEGKIYLKKIIDASQRMQIMINDLLSISMISGNHSFEPYSLQKIMEEALQTLEFKIEQQNAIIRYDELPTAHIIPSQFRQLFQNLLSNSLKFVQPDRQPVITINYAEATESEVAEVNLNPASQYYKIVLSDNGIGFENEFAGKIFAIFQRLHGRSEYEGSGIGLAICKKIVEHHGGAIYARGVPDEGATFTLILPA